MVVNLVYIHIGEHELPNYLYDALYQSLLITRNTNIYILTPQKFIQDIQNRFLKFNLDLYVSYNWKNCLKCVPLEIIPYNKEYDNYFRYLSTQLTSFRNNFWMYTTSRFFYLYEFIQSFQLTNVFHLENDIMLFEDLSLIYRDVIQKSENYNTKIHVIKDHPSRVVPSLMFMSSADVLSPFINYILQYGQSYKDGNPFLNDMQLLANYPNIIELPFTMQNNTSKYIFDGAAIGQYMGGVDPKNLKNANTETSLYNNPSKGFINETSLFKPNTIEIINKSVVLSDVKFPIHIPYALSKEDQKETLNLKQIVNLHIHSKHLYQFSSVMNLKYNDLISGDRILSLCDFVFCSPDIYSFHKNMGKFISMDRVIIIRNPYHINLDELKKHMNSFPTRKAGHMSLFVYTHYLDIFIQTILDHLDPSIKYTLYLHNSDHALGCSQLHYKLLDTKYIHHIYAQNCDVDYKYKHKVTLLPIGIANSMWEHGNMLSVYKTLALTYKFNKTKDIYININPGTFTYRQTVLDALISSNNYEIVNSPKPFKDYLQELSTYRFCLCLRGNGLDTHRFWECLYLGVIPVIINNKYTQMKNFVKYLSDLHIPIFEITDDNLDSITYKYPASYFNEDLYRKILKSYQCNLTNIEALRLNYYKN